MPVRMIIDTDTAGDDVTSLLIGLLHPEARLEAITICVGNVRFEQEVENALYTVERTGRSGEVPVYAGVSRPLTRPWIGAEYVHGGDGMGDSLFPRAGERPAEGHGVDELIRRINTAPGELTIIAQAPLTNIATAVIRDPSIAHKVKRLYVMGGTYLAPGNITPAAEYNFYVDPEAAKIVFAAGFPLYLVDWGLCVRDAVFDDNDLAEIKNLGTDLAEFFLAVNRGAYDFNKRVGIAGTTHPDSIMCAMALDPAIALNWHACHVDIETQGELTRAASVIAPIGRPGVEDQTGRTANAMVCEAANKQRFKALLLDVLRRG
ncbi:MAG: nucleoside hydrolase [Symbiobacteriia bacterium]